MRKKGGLLLTRKKGKKQPSVLFYKAVHFSFNEIAKINNWSQKDANQAVEEYFSLIEKVNSTKTTRTKTKTKKTKTKSPHSKILKGGLHPLLERVMYWLSTGASVGMGLAVGTFDTPCNILLSLIAIGTWSVVVYNSIHNISAEEKRRSLAQPVQYILYKQTPAIFALEEDITNILIHYLDEYVYPYMESIPSSTFTHIVQLVRSLFWEAALYKNFLVIPISCLLKPVIPSCSANCPFAARNRTRTRTRTRSRSIYYTPPST